MKKILIIATLLINLNVFAKISKQDSDKGNGGSITETINVLHQRNFENAGLKIRNFFINNERELQSIFPEFEIKDLVSLINSTQIEVLDKILYNENGKRTGCIYYPAKSKMICQTAYLVNSSYSLNGTIQAVMHEYLKALGLERDVDYLTSDTSDFPISIRLLSYITQTGSSKIATDKRELDENRKSMFTESLTVNLNDNSNPSVEEIKSVALEMTKKRCRSLNKTIIFSDAHIQSLKERTVNVRYICD